METLENTKQRRGLLDLSVELSSPNFTQDWNLPFTCTLRIPSMYQFI